MDEKFGRALKQMLRSDPLKCTAIGDFHIDVDELLRSRGPLLSVKPTNFSEGPVANVVTLGCVPITFVSQKPLQVRV